MSDRLADLEQKKQRLAEMRQMRIQRDQERKTQNQNMNGIILSLI